MNPLVTLIPNLEHFSFTDLNCLGNYVARMLLQDEQTKACPFCKSEHLKKNGHDINENQRLICLDCGKTFALEKINIMQGSRIPEKEWHDFIVEMFLMVYQNHKIPNIYTINKNTATRMYKKAYEAIIPHAEYLNTNAAIIISKEIIRREKEERNHLSRSDVQNQWNSL